LDPEEIAYMNIGDNAALAIKKSDRTIRSEYDFRRRSVNAKNNTVNVALMTSIIGMASGP
jgi:hypothetical protein